MQLLHVHSMYSMFDSAATPDDIVKRAKELGFNSVTLTDHGTMLGVERFMDAGAKYGINTIPGVEAYLNEHTHLILVAKDYIGYQSIIKLMREANTNIETGKNKKLTFPIITDDMLNAIENADHIIATSACIQGPLGHILLKTKRIEDSKAFEQMCELKDSHDAYVRFKKKEEQLTEDIKQTKILLTQTRSYLKPAYIKKCEKLKQMSIMDADQPGEYDIMSANIATAEEKIKEYEDILEHEEKEKKIIKESLSNLKAAYTKYLANKAKFKDVVLYKPEALYKQAKERLLYLKNIFPNFYIELQYHGIPYEEYVMPLLVRLAKETNTSLIAANDAHMADSSEDSLEARRIIRYNYFNRSQALSEADKELYIKTEDELKTSLLKILDEAVVSEAVANTEILNDCKVIFPEEKHYPKVISDLSFDELLVQARDRLISEGVWNEKYQKRFEHEVNVIKTMGYVDYHMVVRDFCNIGRLMGNVPSERLTEIPEHFYDLKEWTEKNNFPKGVGIGPGRGSAAGSLVCYMLGITNIDPIKYNLLFERFLNPERVSMPDIDTDIASAIRPYLIKYLKYKYGEKAVCSIVTETTYGARGAVQMAGRERAAQLYQNQKNDIELRRQYMNRYVYKLSDMIPEGQGVTLADSEEEFNQRFKSEPECELVWQHAKLIEGKLFGTGVHAGGVCISDNEDINEYLPLAWNSEKEVWTAQCDMVRLEEKGLLKMDVLGLNTLDVINSTLENIRYNKNTIINLEDIPLDDKAILENIYASGKTNSVFQFESGGMKEMLKRFKPSRFEDLILLVAAYRPGPIQYLDSIIQVKSTGKQTPSCLTKIKELQPIIGETYGSIIYQEQVMQIFQSLAGYTLGGADLVRRFMSKKKTDKLAHEKNSFIYGDKERNIPGCVNNGIEESLAAELFEQMMEFSKYAFNKSHACCYAYVSYLTAWLKYYYPLEFECAMFNNKKQDEYLPIFEDCKLSNISVLPPDVNKSAFDFCIEKGLSIRYGFAGIKGLGVGQAQFFTQLIKERNEHSFRSFTDFYKRMAIVNDQISLPGKKVIETMILSGCFDRYGFNRDVLAENIEKHNFITTSVEEFTRTLDAFNPGDTLIDTFRNIDLDYEFLGGCLSYDPLKDFENDTFYGCVPAGELADQKNIKIFGFVLNTAEEKDKKGQNILKVYLQGKNGPFEAIFNKKKYFQYREAPIKHRIVIIEGDAFHGKVYGNRCDLMQQHPVYHMHLDNKEKLAFVEKRNDYTGIKIYKIIVWNHLSTTGVSDKILGVHEFIVPGSFIHEGITKKYFQEN